jgi:hypothetical protein
MAGTPANRWRTNISWNQFHRPELGNSRGTDPPPALHNDPLAPPPSGALFSERLILGKLPESEIEQTAILLDGKLMAFFMAREFPCTVPEHRTPPVAPTGFCFAGTFKEGIRETLFFHNHAQAIRSD